MTSLVAVNLPETAEEKLPETVVEAEDFGRGQPFLSIPPLKRRREKRAEKEAAAASNAQ